MKDSLQQAMETAAAEARGEVRKGTTKRLINQINRTVKSAAARKSHSSSSSKKCSGSKRGK